ncbi:hypothetical protein D3C74_450660 [compost metagenome]
MEIGCLGADVHHGVFDKLGLITIRFAEFRKMINTQQYESGSTLNINGGTVELHPFFQHTSSYCFTTLQGPTQKILP